MDISVFSTSPQSADHPPGEFVDHVVEAAQWSEDAGCTGTLVYTDNRLVDAWLVGQLILQNTKQLAPLIAVQPVYMHPYTVANLVTSLGFLYNRRVYLNMVAGGFRNDLLALGDPTPHDERYARLTEYIHVISKLLEASRADGFVEFAGAHYDVSKLKLTPPLPEELSPGIFLSGSSPAGLEAVRATGATCIQYPHPPEEYLEPLPVDEGEFGLRIGIIARPEKQAAWEVAEARFPADRHGALTHQFAMKVSDSQWHKQLSHLAEQVGEESVYWLRPFEHYKTMCPYLVGDYDEVAREVNRYASIGYSTFILDIPPDKQELQHTSEVFARVRKANAAN